MTTKYDSDGREYSPSKPVIEKVAEKSDKQDSKIQLNEPGAAESAVSPSELKKQKA